MDRDWMREKLSTFLYDADHYQEILGTTARWEEQEALLGLMRMQQPTVREILKLMDPELANFDLDESLGPIDARNKVQYGLGFLKDQEEWAVRLSPDAPTLAADRFHPWVWESAHTLWKSQHYRQAVQSAATAISAYTQTKLNRRDLSDTKLMQSAFTVSPKAGISHLVVNASGLAEDTAKGLQSGALSFAVGCYQAIRNPATHEHGDDWSEQLALEYLAALSVLARWIDAATVESI